MAEKKKQSIGPLIRSLVIIIIPAVLLIGLSVARNVISTQYQNKIQTMDDYIQKMQTDLDKQTGTEDAETKKANSKATGLDADRVRKDDHAAQELFKTALNWSSYKEYSAARTALMDKYKIEKSSSFMTEFMPEVVQYEDSEGKTRNIIDDGQLENGELLNMSYVDMVSHVTKIDGGDYSYFTEVHVSSKSGNGGEDTGTCVFEYTVSDDGTISNINAYTVV